MPEINCAPNSEVGNLTPPDSIDVAVGLIEAKSAVFDKTPECSDTVTGQR